jgi:hypothetical protein
MCHHIRRGGIVASVGVSLWALAGCGSARPEPTASANARAGSGHVTERADPAYLTDGSPAMARIVDGIGARTRTCPPSGISSLNGGSPMEIDLFGEQPLACATALAQLRQAKGQLQRDTTGSVNGWRCVWTALPAVACRRGVHLLAASNPGG